MPFRRILVLLPIVTAALVAGVVVEQRLGERGGAPLHGRVVRAVDGDTLVVSLDGGSLERVRLIGVDTPEDVAPGRPVQCWSRQAARFTARVAEHRRVRLTPGRERRDRYGRLLAYVRVEATALELQEALLRGGHARPLAIAPNVDRAARYARLASRARSEGRGAWSHCARLPGW